MDIGTANFHDGTKIELSIYFSHQIIQIQRLSVRASATVSSQQVPLYLGSEVLIYQKHHKATKFTSIPHSTEPELDIVVQDSYQGYVSHDR